MVNKMTLFSILCLFFTSFALKAQITQGELEIIKSELHKGKKELVKENMNLISEEAAVFCLSIMNTRMLKLLLWMRE